MNPLCDIVNVNQSDQLFGERCTCAFSSALQTENGVSIINGNWVIDRPGIFTSVGTQIVYKRPNEIRSLAGESITAPGPLSETCFHL